MEQKHFGSGDNVSGSKSINNTISISLKWWVLIIGFIILAFAVYFSKNTEITGINGNNNTNNDIHIESNK